MNCPVCGGADVRMFTFDGLVRCMDCDCIWNSKEEQPKPDPENPCTDFAKEMSLLHEALKAEGFEYAMVDILAKMAPIVWDKVYFEDQNNGCINN